MASETDEWKHKKSHTPVTALVVLLFAVLGGCIVVLSNEGIGGSSSAAKSTTSCKKRGFLGLFNKKSCKTPAASAALPAPLSSSSSSSSSAATAAAASASAAASTSKADSLMRRRSIANCLAAADGYEAAASSTADATASSLLKFKAADAINCAMRIKGDGNIMILEGTLDTPANKKFWGTHGPRAYALVREARAANPALQSDAAAAAAEMDAFMYSSSAKGILRQAVTGAGTTFKSLATELVSKYGSHDGGVGHCYLGGFFNVAPWPLGDKKRALTEFESAFAKDSRSRRNGYYACLMRIQFGDFGSAVKACETALSYGRCDGPTTPDYCTFLTDETTRLLSVAKKQR